MAIIRLSVDETRYKSALNEKALRIAENHIVASRGRQGEEHFDKLVSSDDLHVLDKGKTKGCIIVLQIFVGMDFNGLHAQRMRVVQHATDKGACRSCAPIVLQHRDSGHDGMIFVHPCEAQRGHRHGLVIHECVLRDGIKAIQVQMCRNILLLDKNQLTDFLCMGNEFRTAADNQSQS